LPCRNAGDRRPRLGGALHFRLARPLPGDVREVIVLADGDDPGEAAARDCAWRWKREGRRVRIARPPQGMDFNDLLVNPAPRIEDGAR
jgi:putative DNA primase/helicase